MLCGKFLRTCDLEDGGFRPVEALLGCAHDVPPNGSRPSSEVGVVRCPQLPDVLHRGAPHSGDAALKRGVCVISQLVM